MFFHIGLVFLLSQPVYMAPTDNKLCAREGDKENGVLEVKCGRKKEVTLIDILGVKGPENCLRKNMKCYGVPHGNLVEINHCYWKQACKFSHKKTALIIASSNKSCIAETTDFIHLSHVRCTKKTKIRTMCEKFPRKEGMVRSHSEYPWDYNEAKKCEAKINFKRQKWLFITVEGYDLDQDSKDMLSIHGPNTERYEFTGRNKTNQTFSFKKKPVKILFTVNNDTKGGRGFLLCYKELKKDTKLNSSVCDLVGQKRRKGNGKHKRKKIRQKNQ